MVVQNSGVGGDALVKGKLVVVLSVDGAPLGHGAELVQKAGCPLASSSDDLFYEIQQLLSDKTRNKICPFYSRNIRERLLCSLRESFR